MQLHSPKRSWNRKTSKDGGSKTFLANGAASLKAVRRHQAVSLKAAASNTATYTTYTETAKSLPLEMEEIELPMNTYKNKTPYLCKVQSVERIVGPKATGETCHIIIDTLGKAPFWEGQSYGVIPPGTKLNSKGKEVPHGVRLYS